MSNCGCKNRVAGYEDISNLEPVAWDDADYLLGIDKCGKPLVVDKPKIDSGFQPYRKYGSLAQGDPGISISLGSITFLLYRLNATEIQVRATSVSSQTISITHRYSGDSAIETKRESFTIDNIGIVIASVGVGQNVIIEFWTRINDKSYDVVCGSDDDALTQAWAEVKTSIVIEPES